MGLASGNDPGHLLFQGLNFVLLGLPLQRVHPLLKQVT